MDHYAFWYQAESDWKRSVDWWFQFRAASLENRELLKIAIRRLRNARAELSAGSITVESAVL